MLSKFLRTSHFDHPEAQKNARGRYLCGCEAYVRRRRRASRPATPADHLRRARVTVATSDGASAARSRPSSCLPCRAPAVPLPVPVVPALPVPVAPKRWPAPAPPRCAGARGAAARARAATARVASRAGAGTCGATACASRAGRRSVGRATRVRARRAGATVTRAHQIELHVIEVEVLRRRLQLDDLQAGGQRHHQEVRVMASKSGSSPCPGSRGRSTSTSRPSCRSC